MNVNVAPFVGAWIETLHFAYLSCTCKSLPSWERGLKHLIRSVNALYVNVAPFVGAWIETYERVYKDELGKGRSLRGSVD